MLSIGTLLYNGSLELIHLTELKHFFNLWFLWNQGQSIHTNNQIFINKHFQGNDLKTMNIAYSKQ